jgi:D-glycero-beta-D-manno-heptose-7-phosphate kinase
MNTKRAEEIFEAITKKKLLVIGDVMLDRYIYGNVGRLNPEAPVPLLEVKNECRETGGAGNSAKNAAGMGAETILVTVGGKDSVADELKEAALKEGYDVRIVEDSDRPTTEKIRYVVRTQQMLRVDYEEKKNISGSTEEEMIRVLSDTMKEVDGVIVSDYAKGSITQKVAEAIMVSSRKTGVPVMADVKSSRINYFTGVDYISPNLKEAHEFLGLNPFDNGKTYEELAMMLRETFDTNVFLTLSEHGIYALDREGKGYHADQKFVDDDDVLDTAGCGDSSATIILLAKMAEATNEEAAVLGHAAGAVNAHKVGASKVKAEEIIDLLKRHGI